MSDVNAFGAGLVEITWLNDAKTHLTVGSRPWPIAVVAIKLRNGLWESRMVSRFGAETFRWESQEKAMREASRTVAEHARYVWRQQMTGLQRYAVGHGKCPYGAGLRLCDQPPAVGSIWCEWHPRGGERQT